MELTPSELEAIVNIHNPALDHLVNPDEYFDVFQGSTRKPKTKNILNNIVVLSTYPSDPSSIDYLDASYHLDQDDFPLSGENLDIENLKDLLKGAENQNDSLAKKTPRTSKMGTTVKPTVRKETKMTKERRGMLEVLSIKNLLSKIFLFSSRSQI